MLFLYGSLQPEGPRFRQMALDHWLIPQGRAVAEGHGLYHVAPDWPGMIRKSGQRTHGTLFEIRPNLSRARLATAFRQLDQFEDYKPAFPRASLYLRQPILVTNIEGEGVEAWAYIYNRPIAARGLIASGAWDARAGVPAE